MNQSGYLPFIEDEPAVDAKEGFSASVGQSKVELICGDCLDVLTTLGKVDAVVSDPPWGISADTDYTRFVGPGRSKCVRHNHVRIEGDERSFDPKPWLPFPIVALWGAHCFAVDLSVGRWLVWVKKSASQLGTFMSDAELCWINRKPTRNRAPGVYVKNHLWHGFCRDSENGKPLHPSQKPIEIMAWTLEMAGVKPGMTVLDPYMGSGSTGVAAVQMGCHFIGIEKHEPYFQIARQRIESAQLKGSLNVSA